ncbi:PAS domain-containing protein [Methanosarcina sp. KYL-1]|uniref:PAS domain-containing protein n=1 Tax=Methanosarcina sp. KYL-1 TaxID=2602068 RepID=UPI0021014C39|nr:PAS domain-containing protein [Methanosarcina sp. KYL-1]
MTTISGENLFFGGINCKKEKSCYFEEAQPFFDALEEMVFVFGKGGRLLYASRAAMKLGYEREELEAMDFSFLCGSGLPDRAEIINPDAINPDVINPEIEKTSRSLFTKGGKEIPVSISLSEGRWEEKTVFFAVAREVKDLKEEGAGIRNLGRERQIILDALNEGLVLIDTGYLLLWANRAVFEKMRLGSPENYKEILSNLIGKPCYEVLHGFESRCTFCPAAEVFKTLKPRSVDFSTPDGRKWHVKSSPLKNREGKIIGAIETRYEITHQAEMEEINKHALEQLERNMKQFAFLLDSIRNPLTVIRLLAELEKSENSIKSLKQIEKIEHILNKLDTEWKNSEELEDSLKGPQNP